MVGILFVVKMSNFKEKSNYMKSDYPVFLRGSLKKCNFIKTFPIFEVKLVPKTQFVMLLKNIPEGFILI